MANRPNPRKFRRETSVARFPVTAAIRRGFPYTFAPVLIAALGLRSRVSGNICFTYPRASASFAILPEKSRVPAYSPKHNRIGCLLGKILRDQSAQVQEVKEARTATGEVMAIMVGLRRRVERNK
jgi:hypothetical protein